MSELTLPSRARVGEAARRARPSNPFPGLRPFLPGEEHLFFGRESQTDRMVDKLAATRFLAVIGSSGSGKSSLVNCGLRVALRAGLMAEAGTAWRIARCRPGSEPIAALARALAEDGVLFDDFRAEGPGLMDIIATNLSMSRLGLVDVVEQSRLDPDVNVLVIVDQFEELFRFRKGGSVHDPHDGRPDEQAVAFVALLIEAARQRRHRVHVVLTMRSDFLGDCAALPGLAEAINEGQYLVPRMTREERRLAITGPLDVSGVRIQPVLLTRLLNDVDDDPDQLSILQHALNRIRAAHLERDRGEGALDLTHYSAIGSMADALDRHAEAVREELGDDRERWIAQRLFRALTDTSNDPRGVRRPTPFGELCTLCEASPEALGGVIDAFRRADRSFLMPPADESLEPDTIVDISHESLMRTWRRLVGWVEEEARSARIYRRLLETARLHARGEAGLWRDPDLARALEWRERDRPNAAWADRYGGKVGQAMHFLDESAAAEEAERDRRREAAHRELEQTRAVAAEQRGRLEAQERASRVQRKVTHVVTAALAATALLAFALGWQIVSKREAQQRLAANGAAYRSAVSDVVLKGQAIWQLVQSRIAIKDDPIAVTFRNLSNEAQHVYTLDAKGHETIPWRAPEPEAERSAASPGRVQPLLVRPDGESRLDLFVNDVWLTRSATSRRVLAAGVVQDDTDIVRLTIPPAEGTSPP